MKRRRFRLFLSLITLLCLWLLYTTIHVELPREGGPLLFFSSNTRQDLRLAVRAAIQQSRRSLHLSLYALGDPGVIKSLNDKAHEGVAITLWMDRQANQDLPRWLHPAIQLRPQQNQGLMHQKLLVIDAEQVWMGSANFTTASLRRHDNFLMALHHPDVAQWCLTQLDHPESPLPPQGFALDNQTLELFWLPAHHQVDQKILELLRTAHKTLRVALFTFTRDDFARELIQAHRRGVAVEVVMDRDSARHTSKKIARKLQGAGIPVQVNDASSLMHHKFAWIDSRVLVQGSANWTKAAFGRNAEIVGILEPLNPNQNQWLGRMWRGLKEDCRPLKNPRKKS